MSSQDGSAVVTLRYARRDCVFEVKIFESIDDTSYLGALTGSYRRVASRPGPVEDQKVIPTELFRSATRAAVIEQCEARMTEIENHLLRRHRQTSTEHEAEGDLA